MATTKSSQAAKRSIKKAMPTTSTKKAIARMPKQAASTLNKRGVKPAASTLNKRGAKATTTASTAQRKRTTSAMSMTKTQLYAMAQKRDLPGRSKMGRDQLAKALGIR
jgi:hypothetical protein